MKKILFAIALLSFMVLGLTGCKKTNGFFDEYNQCLEEFIEDTTEDVSQGGNNPGLYTYTTQNTWSWLLLQ